MSLDFIKTKKEMLVYAEKHGVVLSTKTLAAMKQEYNSKQTIDFESLSTEAAKVHIEPVEGETNTLLITNKFTKVSKVIPVLELNTFCTENGLRLIDVEPIIGKTWLNISGFTFKVQKD